MPSMILWGLGLLALAWASALPAFQAPEYDREFGDWYGFETSDDMTGALTGREIQAGSFLVPGTRESVNLVIRCGGGEVSKIFLWGKDIVFDSGDTDFRISAAGSSTADTYHFTQLGPGEPDGIVRFSHGRGLAGWLTSFFSSGQQADLATLLTKSSKVKVEVTLHTGPKEVNDQPVTIPTEGGKEALSWCLN